MVTALQQESVVYLKDALGRKKVSLLRDMRNNPWAYLIAAPALVYVLIFTYFSYPYMVLAFQRYDFRNNNLWKIMANGHWVGLQNFQFFFQSQDAFRVTFNTIYLNLLFIITGTVMAVIISLFLNELKNKWFVKITQTFMIFPNFISWVVVSYILFAFLSTQYGILNNLFVALGGKAVNFYTNASYWPMILVLIRIWKGTGMSAIIFLATIVGIDTSLYEAASIDGANRFQIMFKITLPLMMPTIIILTLLSLGRIMFGDFGMIYALVGDNGTLYQTTDVIDTYIFRALRQIGDPSQAMAIGLFQSVIGFVLVFGSNWLTRKLYPDGALY